MATRIVRLRLTPELQAEDPYFEVTFDITPKDHSVEVSIDYDTSTGARIDIGCRGAIGWRGWSGGARRRFVIASTEATWGYTPGELELGEWAVVLGLHVVPSAGVDVVVTISTPGGHVVQDPDVVPPRLRDTERGRDDWPAPAGMRWYAGDFHAHTLHSDGRLSPRQLAAMAVDSGLDFLAVTDHNTISHHAELPAISGEYGITLLPGQEVTTARGHANAFGNIPWVDFRQPPQTWVDRVAAGRGILSINHPVSGDCSWQWSLERKPRHAEIMHSSWFAEPIDTSVWSWWNVWGPAVPLGGSDFHFPESGLRPGTPTTWVAAEDSSVGGILSAVEAGRTMLSIGPDAPALVPVGDELIAYGADGTVFCNQDGPRRVILGNRQRITNPGTGPYHLDTSDRRVLAITAERSS